MSTTTTNYGFQKPEPNENVDISVINANMDIIDEKIKINSSEIEDIKDCSIYKSGLDSDGIFVTVNYKRKDGTLKMNSTLSNANSNGNYLTKTEVWYKADGTTTDDINVYTLTYDSDGNCISEVINNG